MTQKHIANADGEESSLSRMQAAFQHVCLSICLSFKNLWAFASELSAYFKISRMVAKLGVGSWCWKKIPV